ncbi:hypothetical protein [Streptomyces toxytricini]
MRAESAAVASGEWSGCAPPPPAEEELDSELDRRLARAAAR